MDKGPYRYCFQVRLHDTDAAGVLFFAHLFRHAHDAYEALMADRGLPLHDLIREGVEDGGFALPITRAEASYERPIRHGDDIEILVTLAETRRRSFALSYRFEDREGRARATARTVHVLTGPGGDLELPERLRDALVGLGPRTASPVGGK